LGGWGGGFVFVFKKRIKTNTLREVNCGYCASVGGTNPLFAKDTEGHMLGLSGKPFHIAIIEHYFEKVKRDDRNEIENI
jgi:hypothetical protein